MEPVTMERVLKMQPEAAKAAFSASVEAMRPFNLLKPTLTADGSQWCALYGENLQVGVAGFGDTPEQAALEFDIAWKSERTPGVLLKKRLDNCRNGDD